MNFPQKIYFNDKPLVMTTDTEAYMEASPVSEMYQEFTGATIKNLSQALQYLERPGATGAIIEGSDEELNDQLSAMYHPIQAGGGLVFNEFGALLLIFRRGKWDLPKGKRDEGESLDECALREVSEETGIKELKLGNRLTDTYHIYQQDGAQYLKHTAWYIMTADSSERLLPQQEENISDARWVSEREIGPYAARTYEAIREVLKSAGLKW